VPGASCSWLQARCDRHNTACEAGKLPFHAIQRSRHHGPMCSQFTADTRSTTLHPYYSDFPVLQDSWRRYRGTRDEQGNIASDPNRPDDEQYIIRLTAQVITLSLGTPKPMKGLPRVDQ
jgi:hypothetical protein